MQKKSFKGDGQLVFLTGCGQGKTCAILEKRSVTIKDIDDLPWSLFSTPKINTDELHRLRGPNMLKRFTSIWLRSFPDNTSLPVLYIQLNVFFHPRPKESFSCKEESSRTPLVSGGIMNTTEEYHASGNHVQRYWRSFLFISRSLFTLYSTWYGS